jgi:hypothetical protein
MGVQYGIPREAEFDKDEGEFSIAQKSQGSGEGTVRVRALEEV